MSYGAEINKTYAKETSQNTEKLIEFKGLPGIEKFIEKRQIGRPKSLKKNRGRPKDTGN